MADLRTHNVCGLGILSQKIGRTVYFKCHTVVMTVASWWVIEAHVCEETLSSEFTLIYFVLCRSRDGRALIVSSTDGFCTVATFEENELGLPYTAGEDSDIDESVLSSKVSVSFIDLCRHGVKGE